MDFKVNTNVTLENICGQYLLLSFGKEKPELPYIQQINETGAFYWHLLEKGYSLLQMLDAAEEEYNTAKEEIRPGLEMFLQLLCEKGFISSEDQECNRDSLQQK